MTQALTHRFDTLTSGVRVRVRTGRAGANQVEWSDAFEARLHLERDARGQTCVLALMEQDWAEYDPRRCLEEDGTLVAEDYYLEVLEVLD